MTNLSTRGNRLGKEYRKTSASAETNLQSGRPGYRLIPDIKVVRYLAVNDQRSVPWLKHFKRVGEANPGMGWVREKEDLHLTVVSPWDVAALIAAKGIILSAETANRRVVRDSLFAARQALEKCLRQETKLAQEQRAHELAHERIERENEGELMAPHLSRREAQALDHHAFGRQAFLPRREYTPNPDQSGWNLPLYALNGGGTLAERNALLKSVRGRLGVQGAHHLPSHNMSLPFLDIAYGPDEVPSMTLDHSLEHGEYEMPTVPIPFQAPEVVVTCNWPQLTEALDIRR